MGADITVEAGYIHAKASRLKGCRLVLDKITVTGTENILMAATLADGITIIENAAKEPEVTDLAHFLNKMGAKIRGVGTDILTVEASKSSAFPACTTTSCRTGSKPALIWSPARSPAAMSV